MVARISTGLTVDAEEVVQDPGLVDGEVAQGRDQVLVGAAGGVAPHPNLDPAVARRATAKEAEVVPHGTARGVEAVTTRDQDLALQAATAGADQGLEDETRRKRRRNRGASQRRTRAGTSRAPGMARPPLGISLVLGKSLGPDPRPHHGRPSSLQTTVDCDASSKPHHKSWSVAEKKQL